MLDKTVTKIDFNRQQVQVGKRRTALDQMGGPRHPLYTTVVQCLSDTPDQRPTSRDLVVKMKELCHDTDELDQRIAHYQHPAILLSHILCVEVRSSRIPVHTRFTKVKRA